MKWANVLWDVIIKVEALSPMLLHIVLPPLGSVVGILCTTHSIDEELRFKHRKNIRKWKEFGLCHCVKVSQRIWIFLWRPIHHIALPLSCLRHKSNVINDNRTVSACSIQFIYRTVVCVCASRVFSPSNRKKKTCEGNNWITQLTFCLILCNKSISIFSLCLILKLCWVLKPFVHCSRFGGFCLPWTFLELMKLHAMRPWVSF